MKRTTFLDVFLAVILLWVLVFFMPNVIKGIHKIEIRTLEASK